MASLLVLKGGTSGQRITLDKASVILGREGKDCDVVIPNQAVSRVHAQITLAQGRHDWLHIPTHSRAAGPTGPGRGRIKL